MFHSTVNHLTQTETLKQEIIPAKLIYILFFSPCHHIWFGPNRQTQENNSRAGKKWRLEFELLWAVMILVTRVSGFHSAPSNIPTNDGASGRTCCTQDSDVMSALDCEQSACCSLWAPGTLPLSSHSVDQGQTWGTSSTPHVVLSHTSNIWRDFLRLMKAFISAGRPTLAQEFFGNVTVKKSLLSSPVWGTKRESSVCESATEVRTHSACVHTEKGVSLPVPRQPEQCSNGPRLHGSAFAQTVTPLLVTTTDGVSHAHCEEGYVTPLRMPSCVFHPIRTTHTHAESNGHEEEKRGRFWINRATVWEK